MEEHAFQRLKNFSEKAVDSTRGGSIMRSLACRDRPSAEVEVLNKLASETAKAVLKVFEKLRKKLSKTACQAGRSVYNTRPRFGGNLKRYQSPGGFELFKKMRSSNSCGCLLMDIATLNIQEQVTRQFKF